MKQINLFFLILVSILLINGCSQKPQSDIDTPAYHQRAGLRAIDSGDYQSAQQSFQRAVDLDRKFASGYGGLALANAYLGDAREAKFNIEKALERGAKDPDVLVLCARTWITLRETEKKWFKRAEDLLTKALKQKKNHEGALYYMGVAYLYHYDFDQAGNYFQKVIDRKGALAGKADQQWQRAQKIVRAMPGTPEGKKVALHEKITRADLAVLFAEELKISELINRLPQEPTGFQTPSQMAVTTANEPPPDAKGHWAETWIKEITTYGIMEGGAGQPFYPEETVTRAEYALAVQRLLVIATGDASLETRYFGESPSRFSDVPSTHPAYNAMALCAERGIMQADVMTGKFNPTGTVSGADALLIIRTLQNSLRMTF